MRAASWLTCLALVGICTTAWGGEITKSLPEAPTQDASYLIYLHGSGIDRSGVDQSKEQFAGITRGLADRGFSVIAEVRPQGAIRKVPEDLDAYARKVAAQVESLLQAKVPARNITIVGYSRGGVIALMVSGLVGNADVGYVVLAGCISERGEFKQYLPMLHSDYATKLKGRFLSLVDESDPDFSSCTSYFSLAPEKLHAQESILKTGKGHQLFATPQDVWIQPVAEWASRK
jgi:hypothetical protein